MFTSNQELITHGCITTLCDNEIVPFEPETNEINIETEECVEPIENNFMVQKVNQTSKHINPTGTNAWSWAKVQTTKQTTHNVEIEVPKKIKKSVNNTNKSEKVMTLNSRKKINLKLLKFEKKTETENRDISDRIPPKRALPFYGITPVTPTQRMFPH